MAAGPTDEELIRSARDAHARRDKPRLASLRSAAMDTRHPLAAWVDYWALAARLNEANANEVEAFYTRWPGSYVEDRLRNDWLLELGRRRDWADFSRDLPRFRMNDDREVACYALLLQAQAGTDVAEAARRAWMAQRDPEDGCQLMAQTLFDAKQFKPDDVWRKVHQAAEHNRPRAARNAAALLGEPVAKAVAETMDSPGRYLALKAMALGHNRNELTAIAIARVAANDPAQAASQLEDRWGAALSAEHAAWAWAQVAKQAALALKPEALPWSRLAWGALKKGSRPDWSDETLGWLARASLRLAPPDQRWGQVLQAIDAMSAPERKDPTWQYWRARALQGLAKPGEAGDAQRAEARQALTELAGPLGFYNQLAAEELGPPPPQPARPLPATPTEREAARGHTGLARSQLLLQAGLRSEGLREWNFSMLGMNDRELLAVAQMACEREIWDRCISSSERSKAEVDVEQRFPMPMREQLIAKATEARLDPAYVYGLIRQESRFVMNARSHVGASGLMQVMPSTATWTAKKIGLAGFKTAMLAEQDTNLRIGSAYLKLVLDDMGGSQALAAAAYNAGPNRARRWREGPAMEPAIWVENIPLHETRDYVKKVLSNASNYAALLSGRTSSLKARLGNTIGPRGSDAPPPNPDLP
ncbi:MAG: lytic transglycosylase domain-containing protein [Vitreoscilla sp.]|nr:lytic transglycosylase domain-containing protein [Vitreoscilla sp.]